ncbi:MAG: endonuclease III [Dehalococcoidia bacterium]
MNLSASDVIERLAPVYGMPVNVPSGDPLAELILTILSQNTADTNSGRAFNAMLRRYTSWEEIAAAPTAELVEAIQPGGLANQKAPRLQRVLQAVAERSAGMNLEFLSEMPLNEANAWLRSLPGVGPKTAACVLLFALGRPALPVDTHVERVSKRLGMVGAKRTPEQAHEDLADAVAPEDYYRFHMLLIKHGRRTCAARKPSCERCPLAADCPASALPG